MLSNAGQYLLVGFHQHSRGAIESLDGLLTNVFYDPVAFRDLPAWCLLFAARQASATVQLDHCQSPSSESHLSGMLLAALGQACEQWRAVIAKPLARTGSTLSLQRIDLSILGGEQATGGDFGLVLDFDGRGAQPGHQAHARIVPLVFQAKRYGRPTADVSQRHPVRGYQHHSLGLNGCASAYIFYENGTKKVQRPLPPLVKDIRAVATPSRTNPLQESVDLATYLLKALYDFKAAPAASSPEEALRMLYAQADPGQLAYLAVISGDAKAHSHYEAILASLAPIFRGDLDDRAIEGESHDGR